MGRRRGKFLVLEGPDGAGKTTQANRLAEHLKKLGRDVVLVREPGGTAVGERVRKILLDPGEERMDALTEAFLFLAARAQLVAEVIEPALAGGQDVVADRFALSTAVYQGYAGGVALEAVQVCNQLATRGLDPDLCLVLDIAPEVGLVRKGNARSRLDRMEQKDAHFQERMRQGYLELARALLYPVKVVDGTPPPERVQQEIVKLVQDVLE